MSVTVGRKPAGRTVSHLDTPSETVEELLSKQDEVLDKLNLIAVAIGAATDGNSLFTQLNTAAIKSAMQKIDLVR